MGCLNCRFIVLLVATSLSSPQALGFGSLARSVRRGSRLAVFLPDSPAREAALAEERFNRHCELADEDPVGLLKEIFRADDASFEESCAALADPNSLMSVNNVLSAAECEALRDYCDARCAVKDTGGVGDDAVVLNDVTGQRSDLANVLPPAAVAVLMALPQYLYEASEDETDREEGVSEGVSNEELRDGATKSSSTATDEPTINISLSAAAEMVIASVLIRRYRSDNHRPCFQFHTDDHTCTINVALSPPEAYSGGDLLALSDESLLEVSERSEGNAVVHWGSVCHAVSPVTEGTRYAMVIFLDNAAKRSEQLSRAASDDILGSSRAAHQYQPGAQTPGSPTDRKMPKLVSTEETKDQGKVAVANNHHGAAATQDHMPPGSEMANGSWIDRFVWAFTDLHVRRPLTTFFSCGFVIVILVAAVAISGNLGNSEEYSRTWDVTDNTWVQKYDILESLQKQADIVQVEGQTTRSSVLTSVSLIMAYETKDGSDVFTPAHLQRMCEMEAKWFQAEDYTEYCPLDSKGNCVDPALSILSLFYGANATTYTQTCDLLSDSAVAAVSGPLYADLATTAGAQTYGFFSGDDFTTLGYTSRTRSMLQVGGPLKGFNTTLDDGDDEVQEEKYRSFFTGVEDEFIKMLNMAPSFMQSIYRDDTTYDQNLDVIWYSRLLSGNAFADILETDIIMVTFSVLFVWVWINIHSESFFLSAIGELQIVLSLPVGRFFYYFFGQITYFSTLQSLVIFLVLGIGADDLFVMVDGWRQSELDVPRLPDEDSDEWYHRRLATCYSRTMQAVFNTSFTTSMAFISTAISPIMPISAFGVYATICIILNYLFVITLTPPAILIHQKYFGGFTRTGCCSGYCYCTRLAGVRQACPCCTVPHDGSNRGEGRSDLESSSTRNNESEMVVVQPEGMCPSNSATISPESSPKRPASNNVSIEVTSETDLLSKVMIGAFEFEWSDGPFKSLKVGAIGSVLVCVALAVFMGVWAAKLELPTEEEQWFPSDHLLQRFINGQSEFLQASSTNYATMSLVWGAEPTIQRPNFDKWKPDFNRGDATFDPDFDLANPEAFNAISAACESAEAKVCEVDGCMPIGYLVQPGSVICAVNEFEAWHEAAYGVSATTLYDPATESAIFFARLETFRTSTSPANYPSRSWGELIGFVDGQLKFLIVEATMTMERTSPNAVKDEVLPVVNELLGSFEKPDSAASVFMAGYSWVWYATNDALLSGMITGLAIAFPVAFGTLIFATQNVVIALYAILTIAMIVISVLGSAALEGWGLGIAESIAAVIVVGFSVDYTIHLGHMYDHGGRHEGCVTSVERARYAMLKMGNTVLAGAVTTCGSGVFMFACQLSFFNKMAFLICNTIAFSLLYALFFFMPLLFLVGPSGSSGHISNFLPGLGSASS